MKSEALKSFTSPAILIGKSVVSKLVMLVIPDFPATRLLQNVFRPIPTGETTPSPVTATLLFIKSTSLFNYASKSYFYLCLYTQDYLPKTYDNASKKRNNKIPLF